MTDVTVAEFLASLKTLDEYHYIVWRYKQPHLIPSLPIEIWESILCNLTTREDVGALVRAVPQLGQNILQSASLRTKLFQKHATMGGEEKRVYSSNIITKFPTRVTMWGYWMRLMKMKYFCLTNKKQLKIELGKYTVLICEDLVEKKYELTVSASNNSAGLEELNNLNKIALTFLESHIFNKELSQHTCEMWYQWPFGHFLDGDRLLRCI